MATVNGYVLVPDGVFSLPWSAEVIFERREAAEEARLAKPHPAFWTIVEAVLTVAAPGDTGCATAPAGEATLHVRGKLSVTIPNGGVTREPATGQTYQALAPADDAPALRYWNCPRCSVGYTKSVAACCYCGAPAPADDATGGDE